MSIIPVPVTDDDNVVLGKECRAGVRRAGWSEVKSELSTE